jgi:hypothetical protein
VVTNRNVYVPINYNDMDESIMLMLLEDYPHLAEEGQGILDDGDLTFAKTYEDPAYW